MNFKLKSLIFQKGKKYLNALIIQYLKATSSWRRLTDIYGILSPNKTNALSALKYKPVWFIK